MAANKHMTTKTTYQAETANGTIIEFTSGAKTAPAFIVAARKGADAEWAELSRSAKRETVEKVAEKHAFLIETEGWALEILPLVTVEG